MWTTIILGAVVALALLVPGIWALRRDKEEGAVRAVGLVAIICGALALLLAVYVSVALIGEIVE